MDSITREFETLQNRRSFLHHAGVGLGTTASAALLSQQSHASDESSAQTGAVGTHFEPKAKQVIFLFMAGAPSHVDLFDYKPEMDKYFKTELPKSISNGQRVTAMTRGKEQLVVPTMFKFQQRGKSGVWMSELLPQLGECADDICFINSMNTDAINHDPGKTSFCTGSEIAGKPSMGAWLSYGLGSLNRDLPDFVVMPSAFWSG